jgi:hypothetical protein
MQPSPCLACRGIHALRAPACSRFFSRHARLRTESQRRHSVCTPRAGCLLEREKSSKRLPGFAGRTVDLAVDNLRSRDGCAYAAAALVGSLPPGRGVEGSGSAAVDTDACSLSVAASDRCLLHPVGIDHSLHGCPADTKGTRDLGDRFACCVSVAGLVPVEATCMSPASWFGHGWGGAVVLLGRRSVQSRRSRIP